MAEYNATVSLTIKNLRSLSNLESQLKKVSAIAERLNKKRIDLNMGGGGNLRDASGIASKQANDTIRGFLNGTTKFGKSVNSINSQLGDFNELVNMTALKGTGAFNKQSVAVKQLATVFTQATAEAKKLAMQQENLIRTADPARAGTAIQAEIRNRNRRSRVARGRERQRRFRDARNSALVGGGFPLLFGGGPIQALAGGLGGGFGAMLGKGGGFAGSIAATAAVQSIQQAITAVGDLGKAMSPFTQNTQALSNALGLVGTPAGKYLETLEQTQGKQAAFNEAMRRMENLVGKDGVKALQDFGEGTRKLQKDITTFLTRISAKIAQLFNKLGGGGDGETGRPVGLARANLLAQGRNTTTGPLADEIQEIVAKLNAPRLDRNTRKDLQNELIDLVQKRNLLQENLDITDEANKRFEKTLENLTEENEHLQNVLRLGKEGAQIEQEKLRIAKDLTKEVADLTPEQVTQIANAVELNNKLKEQREIQEQIKNILATGMTNAVMGLIEGTKTLGSVLADVAKQLASMFLNRAFSSMFDNLFPAPKKTQGKQGLYNRTGGFKAFQYGGVVNSPTMGLIGEGGESEYVIPASKMSGAMARYSAGARGGAVIPGGNHESGTVAGGTGNAIVEYTGPVLNFNGDEYVPKSAVPEIINTAAKQGATAGRSQAFATLKNSRSQRATLGL